MDKIDREVWLKDKILENKKRVEDLEKKFEELEEKVAEFIKKRKRPVEFELGSSKRD